MSFPLHLILLSMLFLDSISADCSCGLEGIEGRIYRGQQAKSHKYPWLAQIRSSEAFGKCGGSLIDSRHIITAAHCVVKDKSGSTYETENIEVVLGHNKLHDQDAKPISVAEILMAPGFIRHNLTDDFAILVLVNPVEFTQSVSPICLPNSDDGIVNMTVAGWGLPEYGSHANNELLEADVQLIPRNTCNKVKRNYLNVTGSLLKKKFDPIALSHICALNMKTRATSCPGDSGGPLMYKSPLNGRWYLVGIVSGSFSKVDFCGKGYALPGLFTRVTDFNEHIKATSKDACWNNLDHRVTTE